MFMTGSLGSAGVVGLREDARRVGGVGGCEGGAGRAEGVQSPVGPQSH